MYILSVSNAQNGPDRSDVYKVLTHDVLDIGVRWALNQEHLIYLLE